MSRSYKPTHRRCAVSAAVGGAALALLIVPAAAGAGTLPPPPHTVPIVVTEAATNYSSAPTRTTFYAGTVTVDDSNHLNTLTDLSIGSPIGGLEMKPVEGQRLHVGHYRVDNTGDPLLAQINSEGTTADSEVEILDLAADAYSHITRVDLLYRIAADTPEASFGEIRMGEPEATDHVLSSHTIYWPRVAVGIAPVLATEWVLNTGATPLAVGRPSVSSAVAGDYSFQGDNCPAELSPGKYCTLRVGFSPRGAGTRTGTLSWPIGGRADLVPLRGEAPVGVTELATTSPSYVNGGPSDEFIEGKYLQIIPFYAGEPRPIGFRTEVYPQYKNTVWDANWDLEVEPPAGGKFQVGTFTVPTTDDRTHWFVALYGNQNGCGGPLSGTLTIRQAAYDADGFLSQVDLDFRRAACSQAPPGAGLFTIHLSYRSTVTPLQYVTPGPAQVTAGAIVPITGMAKPGSAVTVWFRRRGTGTFIQRRTLTANSTGRWATSYEAMDDYVYYAKFGTYLPVQYRTQIKPALSAPATVHAGQVVTVSGTGTPGSEGQMEVKTPTSDGYARIFLDSSGRFSYRYTATETTTFDAWCFSNYVHSGPLTVTVVN